jgi:VanZ family protein
MKKNLLKILPKETVLAVKNWLPAVLWIGCIFFLSTASFSADHTSRIIEPLIRFFMPHITSREIETIHFFIRKAAHLTEYCIASLLLFHSFRNTTKFQKHWRWAFYSVVGVMCIATMDEFLQSFVTSRTSSVVDIGIDTVGGILGQVISITLYRLRRSNKERLDIV